MRINPLRARLGRWDHCSIVKHFSSACCSNLLLLLCMCPLSFLVPLALLFPMPIFCWAAAVPFSPLCPGAAAAAGWPFFPSPGSLHAQACSSCALLREAPPRRWSGRLSISQEQGTPQNISNVQKNSDVHTSPTHCSLYSHSVQFFSFHGLVYFLLNSFSCSLLSCMSSLKSQTSTRPVRRKQQDWKQKHHSDTSSPLDLAQLPGDITPWD